MAYNKFKRLEQLRKQLNINDIQSVWLPAQMPNFLVSQHLLDSLIEATNEPLRTEKAKSEYIIVPVIRELRRKNVNRFSSFSGFELDVDKSQELTGFCDFIFSADINRGEITAPIFCLVEAKNDNVEKGIAQCGAEMYAAKLYNEKEGNPREVIYGCVTTAFSWCFLKLEGKNLFIDPNFVPLTFTEPHRVLAALQWILEESLKPKS